MMRVIMISILWIASLVIVFRFSSTASRIGEVKTSSCRIKQITLSIEERIENGEDLESIKNRLHEFNTNLIVYEERSSRIEDFIDKYFATELTRKPGFILSNQPIGKSNPVRSKINIETDEKNSIPTQKNTG